MTHTTYTHARAHFAEIWDRVINDQEPVFIRRRGAEDVVMVPADEFRSMQETLRLFMPPADGIRLMTALERAYARTEPTTDLAQLREELRLYGDDGAEDAGETARRSAS